MKEDSIPRKKDLLQMTATQISEQYHQGLGGKLQDKLESIFFPMKDMMTPEQWADTKEKDPFFKDPTLNMHPMAARELNENVEIIRRRLPDQLKKDILRVLFSPVIEYQRLPYLCKKADAYLQGTTFSEQPPPFTRDEVFEVCATIRNACRADPSLVGRLVVENDETIPRKVIKGEIGPDSIDSPAQRMSLLDLQALASVVAIKFIGGPDMMEHFRLGRSTPEEDEDAPGTRALPNAENKTPADLRAEYPDLQDRDIVVLCAANSIRKGAFNLDYVREAMKQKNNALNHKEFEWFSNHYLNDEERFFNDFSSAFTLLIHSGNHDLFSGYLDDPVVRFY